MSKKFSLIMATYGREQEVNEFLRTILESDYDKNFIEIIIVDQNDKIDLKPIINKYESLLNIIYIKSDRKGLSYNRNIGIEKATGDIIAFPDDDCEYIKDTLTVVNNYFDNNDCDVLMGRIIEKDGSDSLRRWPKEFINIDKFNYYTKCSSVTVFLKKSSCKIALNNNLGAGTTFGACEDADLIYRNIKNNKNVIYNPEICIYHPHYNSNHNMSYKKIYSYGLGFGAMVKSNFDFHMIILFLKAEVFHLLKIIKYIITFNFKAAKGSYYAFISRIAGLIKYKC